MKSLRKGLCTKGLVMVLTLMSGLTLAPAQLWAAPAYDRLGGMTQYDTAAAIAASGGNADTAIIAVGTVGNSYDALAAAPLAAKENAPLLLTEGDRLTSVTQSALKSLDVKNVYLIGGTGVIKPQVEQSIKDLGITVTRIAGYDAAETSVKIAEQMGNVTVLALTGGRGQDALSIAPVAAAKGIPVLYTDSKTKLPDSIVSYLETVRGAISQTYIIGGTGVIGDSIATRLPGQAQRLAGADAYDTNVAVISNFADTLNFGHVYVANGATMVDALAGAPLAAEQNAPLLLTDNTALKAAAAVNGRLSAQSMITALGGTAVVSEATLHLLAPQADGGNPGATPLSLNSFKALDRQTLQVRFNHGVSDPGDMQWALTGKQGTVSGYTVSWSADKTQATFSFSAPLADGRYTVKAAGETFFTGTDTAACSLLSQPGINYSMKDISPLAGYKNFAPDSTVTYARRIEVQATDADQNVYPVDSADILSVTSGDTGIATVAQEKNDWYIAGKDIGAGGNAENRSVTVTIRLNTLNGVRTIEQTVEVSPQEPEIQKIKIGYELMVFPTRNFDPDFEGLSSFEFASANDALLGQIVGIYGLDQYGVWQDVYLDRSDVTVADVDQAPSNAFEVFLDASISVAYKQWFRMTVPGDNVVKNQDIKVTIHHDKAVKEVTVKILAP